MKSTIIKIAITIIVIFYLNFNFIYAQVTAPTNTLTGTAPNPAEYIGSSNGYHVVFKAAGNPVGKIDQGTGNWCIGTGSPSNTLTVNGTQDITGSLGIGITSPVSLLHIDGNTNSTGDVFRTDAPNALTTWRMLRGGTEYGRLYNNNDNHFYLQATNGSGDLIFNTGGANDRMHILSGGNVGINMNNPGFRLDVNGDINGGGTSTNTTNSYRLGTNRVLWHNGSTSRIFVGVGAGANATGLSCTFVGSNAGGGASCSGAANTFIGADAGSSNTSGQYNTFIGSFAGDDNQDGHFNAFTGFNAGCQ